MRSKLNSKFVVKFPQELAGIVHHLGKINKVAPTTVIVSLVNEAVVRLKAEQEAEMAKVKAEDSDKEQ